MSTAELLEEVEYAARNPWGEDRDDWRAASIVSAVANAFRGKDSPAIKPSECLLRFEEPKKGAKGLGEMLSGRQPKKKG
jgi:hypothetical protein